MEMRHITDDDYLKIINICKQILRGGDFEELRNKLLELYRQIIELQPLPPITLDFWGHKKKAEKEIKKSREKVLLDMIEAAKYKNNIVLVFSFSKLR